MPLPRWALLKVSSFVHLLDPGRRLSPPVWPRANCQMIPAPVKKTPLEKGTLGKVSLKGTRSGAEEEFLLLVMPARTKASTGQIGLPALGGGRRVITGLLIECPTTRNTWYDINWLVIHGMWLTMTYNQLDDYMCNRTGSVAVMLSPLPPPGSTLVMNDNSNTRVWIYSNSNNMVY